MPEDISRADQGEKEQFVIKKINSIKADLLSFINQRLFDGKKGNARVIFTIRDKHVQEKDIMSWRYWIGLDEKDINDIKHKDKINCFLGHADFSSQDAPCVFIDERDVSGTACPGQNWMFLDIPEQLSSIKEDDFKSAFYFHRTITDKMDDLLDELSKEIFTSSDSDSKEIIDKYKHKIKKAERINKQNELTSFVKGMLSNKGIIIDDDWINKYKNENDAGFAFLMRAIDYFYLFQGFNFILSYGLIFGGYHLITFYILLKNGTSSREAMPNGTSNLTNDWTSIDKIIENWNIFGKPFFGGSDAKLEFLRFLGEIESVINTCWTETLNSILAHEAYIFAYEGKKLLEVLTETCEEMLLMQRESEAWDGKDRIPVDKSGKERKCAFTENCFQETNFHIQYADTSSILEKVCKCSENLHCISFHIDNTRDRKIEMAFKKIKNGNLVSANINIPRIIKAFCEQYASVISTTRTNLIRAAIVNILVDSFSHNIGAHSLSEVVWNFAQRDELLEQRYEKINKNGYYNPLIYKNSGIFIDDDEEDKKKINAATNKAAEQYSFIDKKDSTYNENYFSLNDIIKYFPSKSEDNEKSIDDLLSFTAIKGSGDEMLTPKWPIPIDGDTMKYVRYIKNKAAFWNGVTSDVSFGGEQVYLYDLLFEFIDNPLFLSTVANTENILKVTISFKMNEICSEVATIEYSKEENRAKIDFKGDIKIFERKWKAKEYRIYLPGGTVGKHAFYTILENTIRNIKHADNPGTELKLTIAAKDEDANPKKIKVTVWLNNPSKVNNFRSIQDKAKAQILNSDGDIILGGSSQDQVCAAMLMTNKFAEVENISENQPWINLEEEKVNGLTGYSLIKKSFSLWKGEFFHKLTVDDVNDNQSRYRFLIIPKDKSDCSQIVEIGSIRLLKDDFINGEGSLGEVDIYKKWLKKWLDEETIIIERSSSGKNESPFKILGNSIVVNNGNSEICGQKILFAHGASNKSSETDGEIHYRNHGALRQYYKLGDKLEILENMSEILKCELIETIKTRIQIFDNRLFNRVFKKNRLGTLSKFLSMDFNNENHDEFIKILNKITNSELKKPNIFIMHLTMIEKMHDANGKEYGEWNVANFIDDKYKNILNDKCKLIIVTGRGRDEWLKKMKSEYNKNKKSELLHVMSKPIESMLSAVEDGLILGDDFNIKHNICKIVFGS